MTLIMEFQVAQGSAACSMGFPVVGTRCNLYALGVYQLDDYEEGSAQD